jgi:hypothetical protein
MLETMFNSRLSTRRRLTSRAARAGKTVQPAALNIGACAERRTTTFVSRRDIQMSEKNTATEHNTRIGERHNGCFMARRKCIGNVRNLDGCVPEGFFNC